ncbi:PKD domain-containing protein [Pontibacter cellulosilyticus]|uniref:PKD domain-containing protein n=1 Tax=Pontibacter cellulosilyticus TaxID=1720253 RepID=A0A923SIQ8_9BACT|nr:PKD domain-containing protein [Pontibacter cellulosilyticus]MBC5993008.1 PKD domain-containing protein [Pontibacter cellulosilyticus]
MNYLYRNKYGERYASSPKPSNMKWHLLMLLISALLVSSNVFAQTCPDLNCTSNDVTVQRVYLADVNGVPLTSACTPGEQVQAYLHLVVSTNTPRVGAFILGTLKIDGMADQAVANCFGVALTGNNNILKYPTPVNWTCGKKIMLVDIFVAWGTGNTDFCVNPTTCSSIVPSKCRREAPIVVEAPLIASFTARASCTENNRYETIAVSGSATGGKAPYTYAWDFNNDGVTDATTQNATYTYMSTGEKMVKLTVTDSSSPAKTDMHTSMVMVNACCTTPDANAGDDMVLTCTTTSVVLNGSSATMGATYAWVASNGGNIVSGGATLTPTVNAAGTYTLTVTTARGGCTASDVVVVAENKVAPDVNISTPSVPHLTCTTPTAMLGGYSSVQGATYKWTGPDGFTATTQGIEVSVAGIYTLTVTDPANGCTASKQVSVTEDKEIILSAGLDKELSCKNTSIMLDGSTSVPEHWRSVSWTASNGGNIVSGAHTLTPTVNAAGTYTLKVVNSRSGCEATDVVVVTMDDTKPTAQATGGMLSCATGALQLKGSSTTPGVTYSWTGPNGFTSIEQNPTVTVAGTYILTVTKKSNGCSATATAIVTPQPTPEPELTCHMENFSDEKMGLVSVLNTPAGPVSVFGHKRNPDGSYAPQNHAAIFDTQAPTGDDTDLYTVDWHHVLIINQDQTNVPNDNQWGGELVLDFAQTGPVVMTSMRALDIDGYESNSWIYLYGDEGQELYKVKLQALGNNSRQTVDLGNTRGVMKMKIVLDGRNEMMHLAGSGAFDELKFCIENEVENPCNEVPMASAESNKAVAYPMPFSDRTTVEFTFVKGGEYVANLYDLRGNLLKELQKGTAQAGQLTNVEVDGRSLLNGIYIARIVSGNEVKTVKLILRK